MRFLWMCRWDPRTVNGLLGIYYAPICKSLCRRMLNNWCDVREKNAILCFLHVFVQDEGEFSHPVSRDCVFTPVRKSRKAKWQRGKVVGDFYFLAGGDVWSNFSSSWASNRNHNKYSWMGRERMCCSAMQEGKRRRGEEGTLFSTWDSIFSSVAAALSLFPSRTGRLNLAGTVAKTWCWSQK